MSLWALDSISCSYLIWATRSAAAVNDDGSCRFEGYHSGRTRLLIATLEDFEKVRYRFFLDFFAFVDASTFLGVGKYFWFFFAARRQLMFNKNPLYAVVFSFMYLKFHSSNVLSWSTSSAWFKRMLTLSYEVMRNATSTVIFTNEIRKKNYYSGRMWWYDPSSLLIY